MIQFSCNCTQFRIFKVWKLWFQWGLWDTAGATGDQEMLSCHLLAPKGNADIRSDGFPNQFFNSQLPTSYFKATRKIVVIFGDNGVTKTPLACLAIY